MRIKNGNETRSDEFWRPGIGIPSQINRRIPELWGLVIAQEVHALSISFLAIIPTFPPSETLQSFARGGDQTIIDTKDEDLCKAAVQEGLDRASRPGECDYYRRHPEAAEAARRAAAGAAAKR
jgi:hypothetical protein